MRIHLFLYLLIIIALAVPSNSTAQSQQTYYQIDSLKKVFYAAESDSSRARIADDISYVFYTFELDSSIQWAKISGTFAQRCGNQNLYAQSYNSIGVCMVNRAALISALENFNQAYAIYHAIQHRGGEAKTLNNLGVIYSEIKDYNRAIEKYKLSYEINMEQGLWLNASQALYNVALNEMENGQIEEAAQHASVLRALKAQHHECISADPIFAQFYLNKNQLDSALHYARLSTNDPQLRLETQHSISSKVTLSEILLAIGNLPEADRWITMAEDNVIRTGYFEQYVDVYRTKAKVRAAQGRYQEAYDLEQKFFHLEDSLDNLNQVNIIHDINARYETERMEAELKEQHLQLEENKVWFGAMIIIACFILAGLLAVLYFLKRNRKLNRVLQLQNDQISSQRQKIINSINYAKKIQQSTLPKEAEFKKLFRDSFIYFKPKDIISGDFYSYQVIDGKTYVATIDCTGHGVPGALMSLIAIAKLNRVVNELNERDPARIILAMHQEIMLALRQDRHEDNAQDGMEMSLVIIDSRSKTISFASAGGSIQIANAEQITEYRGHAMGIGGATADWREQDGQLPYQTVTIPYKEHDVLFMYSDGFHDQMGGPDGRKLNKSKFKDMLHAISQHDLREGNDQCEKVFQSWKQERAQTDDIMVVGIRL